MFSEQWQLDTQPILSGGAAIRVLLKGLALQDDLNAEKRAALEAELGQRQLNQIIQSIMDEILDGVRSPERPASPIDAYITVCSSHANVKFYRQITRSDWCCIQRIVHNIRIYPPLSRLVDRDFRNKTFLLTFRMKSYSYERILR